MNSDERNYKLNNLTIDTESVQDGGVLLSTLGLSPLSSMNTPSLVTPFKVPGMPNIKLDSHRPTAVLSSNGVNIMSPQLGMSGYGTNVMTGQQTIPPAGMTMKSSFPAMLGLSPDNTLSPVAGFNNMSSGVALSPVAGVSSMGMGNLPFGAQFGQTNNGMMLGLTPNMNTSNNSNVLGVALPQDFINNKPGDVVLGGISGLDMGGYVNQPMNNNRYSVCTNGNLDPSKVEELEKMMKRGIINDNTQIGICNDTTVTAKKIGEFANTMYNNILMGKPINFTNTRKPSGYRPMSSIDVIGSPTVAKYIKRNKFQGHVDGKFTFGMSNGSKAFIMNNNGQISNFGSAGAILVERKFGNQGKPAIILFRDTKYGTRNVYSDLGGEIDRKDLIGKNPLWVTAAREALEESCGLVSIKINETTPFVDISKRSGSNIFRSFIVGIPSGFFKRNDFKRNYYALKNRNMSRVWYEMDDIVRIYAHELVDDLNRNKHIPTNRFIKVRSIGSGNVNISPRVRHILTNALTPVTGKTVMQQAIDNLHNVKIETHNGGKLGGLKKLRIE